MKMIKVETVILHFLCIYCLCFMSQAVTIPSTYTTEIESHNKSSSNILLENLWKIEWGPLPKNLADMKTILWYSLSQTNGIVNIETIDNLRECLSVGKNCKDIVSNNLNEPLSLLTNCTVNTDLSPELCNALQKCNDTSALLSSLVQDVNTIKVSDLDDLLPVLTYQFLEGHCQVQDDDSLPKTTSKHKKPQPAEGNGASSTAERLNEGAGTEEGASTVRCSIGCSAAVWGYGFLFVTLISGCSLAGVFMLPLIGRHFYDQLVTSLVGLAVGSLAASALFHLIPEAFHMKKYTGNRDYLFMCLYILLGIWGFFMIERLIKIITMSCSKNKDKKSPPISDSAHPMLYDSEHACGKSPYSANGTNITCGSHNEQQINLQKQAIHATFREDEPLDKDNHHSHKIEFTQGKDSVIKTVAWMIIFGDGFHNFIDGVSIGAAFSESILTGVSISLAVMCEELPHELGDFAVLLNAGMTMKQAVMYNFLSAMTCYLGLVLGILLGEFTENNSAIFAIAAGMFLYIALSDMIPEMNEVASKATNKGLSSSLFVLLLQNIGIFIGIAVLFTLAYFEDSIKSVY